MVVQCPVGIPNYRKGFDVYGTRRPFPSIPVRGVRESDVYESKLLRPVECKCALNGRRPALALPLVVSVLCQSALHCVKCRRPLVDDPPRNCAACGADASTGIEEDISKVVVKDGEVMPGWTDEDAPSVAHDRAVIPGDVQSAVFYLMMADEDLAGLPRVQEVDAPDVFTDREPALPELENARQ